MPVPSIRGWTLAALVCVAPLSLSAQVSGPPSWDIGFSGGVGVVVPSGQAIRAATGVTLLGSVTRWFNGQLGIRFEAGTSVQGESIEETSCVPIPLNGQDAGGCGTRTLIPGSFVDVTAALATSMPLGDRDLTLWAGPTLVIAPGLEGGDRETAGATAGLGLSVIHLGRSRIGLETRATWLSKRLGEARWLISPTITFRP